MHEIYTAEKVTGAYRKHKELFPDLTGSKYLGAEYPGRKIFSRWHDLVRLHHADLSELSFTDSQFNPAITQDVFEHISNYRNAFEESYRVL